MLEHSAALDKAFHALSDATRRGLLERLSQGPASVSELARPYDCTLAAIHQHVQILESSGLVTTQKHGRVRQCSLSPAAVLRVETWLSERRQLWQGYFDRLGQMLENEEDQG